MSQSFPPNQPSPDSPHEPQTFPSYRVAEFLPMLALGWALGAALTFGIRWLGAHLPSPCEGHTLLALAVPLLLGPGGLAFLALTWRQPARAALGLGLLLSSFLPGLYVGARDIGNLRTAGCAGGYVVIAKPEGRSRGTLVLHQGETRQLTARIGGFHVQTHPELFTLSTDSTDPSISLRLSKVQAHAGETVPLTITVRPDAPLNTFTAGIEARQVYQGKTYIADGSVEIEIKPAATP